jgi:hypothetical protein
MTVAFLIKFLFCCIIEVALLELRESPLPSTLLGFMVYVSRRRKFP